MMDHLFDIKDRRAVVTGAAGDFGRQFVEGLSSRGARVMALDFDENALNRASEQWDHTLVSTHVVDLRQPDQIMDFFQNQVPRILNGLDILENNAGVMHRATPENTGLDQWRNLLSINLDAAFLCAREAGKIMLEAGKGSIINISSISSVKALDLRVAYCTSKAAISHMTRVMALEWGNKNVRVNAIAPGFIRSRMNADLRKIPERYKAMTEQVPLKRFGETEELVGPMVFLASDASSYVNGHILFTDGGLQTT